MLVFHSKLCPGIHCYRAKPESRNPLQFHTILAPCWHQVCSLLSLFSIFNFFIAFAHYFPDWAPSPYCASRAPSLGSGFWSWQHGKDRSVWPDWPHPVALWVASIDTHKHMYKHASTHTHHLESTDSFQMQPKRWLLNSMAAPSFDPMDYICTRWASPLCGSSRKGRSDMESVCLAEHGCVIIPP